MTNVKKIIMIYNVNQLSKQREHLLLHTLNEQDIEYKIVFVEN